MIVTLTTVVTAEGDTLPIYPQSIAITERDAYDAQIADSTTNKDVYPGDIATSLLVVILSDQDITYVANGSDTALPVNANVPVVLHDLTSLTVSNASGSTARIRVWYYG